MNYLFVLVIIITLYYISNHYSEPFTNYYTKNEDLNYIKKRLKIPNTRTQKIPVSPITIKTNDKKIKAVDGYKDSTRIPDDNSDMLNYVINHSKSDDVIDSPIDFTKFKKKKCCNKAKISKKKNKKIKKTSKIKESELKSCLFVSSINNEPIICPKNYSLYTGAKVGSTDDSLVCNSDKPKTIQCKATSKVKKGKIENIMITEPGMNYFDIPKVKITGLGKGARAIARIKDRKVNQITIVNKGIGYKNNTKILIEKPQLTVFCNLCCKK